LPYRNERIINVIRDLYFTGGSDSFATCFDHVFTRYRDSQGVEKPELPDQMVALVATGVKVFILTCQCQTLTFDIL
jgi:hypothetical protein